MDRSTRQFEILPHAAHLAYWDDPRVAAVIADALGRCETDGTPRAAERSSANLDSDSQSWQAALSLTALDRWIASSWKAAAAAALVLGALTGIAVWPRDAGTDSTQGLTLGVDDRREVTGWLYQFSDLSRFRADKGLGWAIVFTPEGGTPLVFPSYRPRFVTYRGGEPTHVWYESPRRKVDAERFPVRVLYAAADPTIHFVPGLEENVAAALKSVGDGEHQNTALTIVAEVIAFAVGWMSMGMLIYAIWPPYLGTGAIPLPPGIRQAAEWMKRP